MRWLLATAIFALSLPQALADGSRELPGFTKLRDALAFIDTSLDNQDVKPFQNFLRLGIDAEYLKIKRGNMRLANEAKDKEFPSSEKVYGIELLNEEVYAQFSKIGRKWYFDEIRGNK